MAARRILSLLAANTPQTRVTRELSRSFHHCPNSFHHNYEQCTRTRSFHHCPNSFHHNYEQCTRTLQTVAESSIPSVQNSTERENCGSNHDVRTSQNPTISEKDQTAAGHRVNSSLKISDRHDLVMMFTCKVCDTRSMKTACRDSYEKGVVVVRCDGCKNLHLIADRLGWFGEPGSVEEFLAARGEEVTKGSADTLNLTLEDLAGKKNLDV